MSKIPTVTLTGFSEKQETQIAEFITSVCGHGGWYLSPIVNVQACVRFPDSKKMRTIESLYTFLSSEEGRTKNYAEICNKLNCTRNFLAVSVSRLNHELRNEGKPEAVINVRKKGYKIKFDERLKSQKV